MRILLSGATGVVGRRLVPLLLAEGHKVTALSRPGASAPAWPAGVSAAVGDLFDPPALARAVAGHDAVVNLATHMPKTAFRMLFRRAWRANDRIRREGAGNLAAAALAGGATRFVQESFALAYPDRGGAWIGEDTPLAPARYNRTVLDAEAAAARFAADGRIGVVLRFAAFYGPDAMQVRAYVDGVRKGFALLPGARDGFVSSIAHDDAAAAVAAALDAPSGAYNAADDEPVTRAVYFGALAEALGVPAPRFLPGWTTPLLGTAASTLARSLRISNRKLRSATGWRPKHPGVRQGWPATVAEMQLR
jgi:nucleoside-diphosphate-sugar epimerase